ncbi:hypothetical protein psyc5s11_51020 [Clostridium gelidum]|uniref:Uncharacterized protein n=1 Tax=Clostridium gelidum TaxID=704125 RepID=A0ABM7TD62_9CLOT|nr:hypothetical protein [Clostridium gelidum]BCZ49035.1 hypothetical protein psyc5s11_51020 [Clostridium gelidum]
MDKEILEILKRLETKMDKGLDRLETKIDKGLGRLETKINVLGTKLDEHTLILRALEHSSEVNKAEHDKMSNDIAKIQGDVTGIRKDLSQVELVTANNWADIVKLKAVE